MSISTAHFKPERNTQQGPPSRPPKTPSPLRDQKKQVTAQCDFSGGQLGFAGGESITQTDERLTSFSMPRSSVTCRCQLVGAERGIAEDTHTSIVEPGTPSPRPEHEGRHASRVAIEQSADGCGRGL